MRFGLSVAIVLGGIISMAVLVVGTAITGEYSYQALADVLSSDLGRWAGYFFGIGLFAAGFSSGITAPLASAITAKSLFGKSKPEKWQTGSLNYRLVWGAVLVIGVGFGCADLKPEPAIIIAQALNGLILPLVSIFLLFVVNDPGLMGKKYVNRWHSNILLGLVVWVTLILGLMNIVKASIKTLNYLFEVLKKDLVLALTQNNTLVVVVALVTLLISMLIWWLIYSRRQRILGWENSS
ncbi:MAG: divalent metal cation transporter, partial [Planctomycetes bacterium]|nr:divalent metal cation transporter [Planctomycetota bacterium]